VHKKIILELGLHLYYIFNMKKIFPLWAGIAVALLISLVVLPLEADDLSDRFDWAVNGGMLYFPEDNGNGGDSAPILSSFGADFAFNAIGPLWVELTEDLYFTHYAYNFTLARAVPAAIENRSAFVFAFLTGIQALGRFRLNDSITARVYGGPAADFRAVVLAANLHPDDFTGIPESDASIQTDAVRKYFWEKGRWFLPVSGIGMDFAVNERYKLGFDLRIWFPVYRLWAGEELPTVEGWRFGAGIRVSPH
jgi:hypothetical protein